MHRTLDCLLANCLTCAPAAGAWLHRLWRQRCVPGTLHRSMSLAAGHPCKVMIVIADYQCPYQHPPVHAGAAMPIFALVIGRMVNTLGKGGDPSALYGQLNDTTLFFLYLAIVSFFVCYLEIAMWMLTGARSLHAGAHPCMPSAADKPSVSLLACGSD